jgi:hypothetical protein
MSRWTFCFVFGALLLPVNAAAQMPRFGRPAIAQVEQPREPEKAAPPLPPAPSRPSPLPPAPASGDRDLFRAVPGTFDPRFDRLLTPADSGLFFPTAATLWPAWSTWGSPWHEGYRRAGEVRPVEPTVRIIVEHRQVPAAPAPPPPVVTLPAATVPPPAGHRRALYVIPGCYAGDKLPRRDQLRPGCDAKNVRVISPAL